LTKKINLYIIVLVFSRGALQVRIYLPEVKQNQGEAVNYRYSGSISDFFGREENDSGRLDVVLDVCVGGDKVIVRGTMQASLDTECSRCLQQFRQELKSDFQESFLIIPRVAETEDPELLAVEAANELSVAGNYLYLNEFLRQIFVLAQEYNPLCKPDCMGLCVECGTDLNSTTCGCRTDSEIDLRLLKLKELSSDS
jgi:uncharacterized protein